jgi:hypothetical protein
MNSKQLDSETPKKPYRKPEFIQVALRPEEAVLGACKSGTHGGPGGASTCNPNTCHITGS